MSNANELDPVTEEVYDFLRRQPGDSFGVETIASQLEYDADDIETSLAQLLAAGVVEQRGGSEPEYILSTAAPEL